MRRGWRGGEGEERHVKLANFLNLTCHRTDVEGLKRHRGNRKTRQTCEFFEFDVSSDRCGGAEETPRQQKDTSKLQIFEFDVSPDRCGGAEEAPRQQKDTSNLQIS